MTKGEIRKARKTARAAGVAPVGDAALAGDRDKGAVTWTESTRGLRARYRWARRYDALNGAPESDDDR